MARNTPDSDRTVLAASDKLQGHNRIPGKTQNRAGPLTNNSNTRPTADLASFETPDTDRLVTATREDPLYAGSIGGLYTLADGGTTLAYSSAQASTPTSAAAASVIDPSAAALYERVIFITLKNVSLTTMCALLYYIYTNGVLDLSVKLGRFAISRCDLGNANGKHATRMVWCDTEGRFDASRDWYPLENHSPWKLKDVTWSELWEASTLFRITDLQTLCRDGVIDGIDESNAVDVLFSKAAVDVDIKNAAMAKVVQNIGSILAKAEDPFAPYRHHPDYHDILIQLMRLKVKND
ncbi:hypothetical protein BGX24_003760 [Mortierella sp. AD032]|nr:hypothetical protein BGX24_003760 [Mortierella sp. AD032]